MSTADFTLWSIEMDRILIRDLRVRCIIGINEDERREKQDVVINLALSVDLRHAGKSDRFEDTVDYRALKKRIVAMVEDSHFYLIEALAEAVANICLENPQVQKVQVSLDKPYALRFAQSVGVEIVRWRENE
jgi:D-erythro-7,8-dihydroneopterin triphosphate epimerase